MSKVQQARAAAGPASAARPPTPEREPPPAEPAARPMKPLEGDAKLGAARLLARDLLPVITARHLAGRPLIDPAADDLSLYQLLRRLVASTNATEIQIILGSLPDDQRAATVALVGLLNLKLPTSDPPEAA